MFWITEIDSSFFAGSTNLNLNITIPIWHILLWNISLRKR